MSDRKVLIEQIFAESHPVRLCESELARPDGKLFLEGIAIQGEKKNHNQRIYPKTEIEKAVASVNERIQKTGPILGECDHPEGLTTSLKNVSHLIEKMWMDGADGYARFQVIDAGYGEIVRSLVRAGARVGVSSRGSGNVDNRGVVSDFDILTIDVVANPSAPDAYPRPIMESLLSTAQGRKTHSLMEAVRNDPKAQRYFQKEVLEFIKKFNGN